MAGRDSRRAVIKPSDPVQPKRHFPESLRCTESVGLPSFGFWLRDVVRRYLGSTESHPTGLHADRMRLLRIHA